MILPFCIGLVSVLAVEECALNRRSKLILLLSFVAAAVLTPGCGFVHKLQAKDNLNEGVRDFNKARYRDAKARFERALDLDPDNANAQLFYARALNALFDQDLTEELGEKTLQAYQTIIDKNADDHKAVDRALAFRARVFEQLAGIDDSKAEMYKDKQRQTLLERANLPIADEKAKADVYYTIGQGYWADSYHIYSKRYTRVEAGKLVEIDIPADIKAKMKPLIDNAHTYLQKAIAHKPDYADAWIYEKLVYIEQLKLESDPARRRELETKRDEAQENYKKFLNTQPPAA
jgi:tetratricopeptide (TPR) repeat protein